MRAQAALLFLFNVLMFTLLPEINPHPPIMGWVLCGLGVVLAGAGLVGAIWYGGRR